MARIWSWQDNWVILGAIDQHIKYILSFLDEAHRLYQIFTCFHIIGRSFHSKDPNCKKITEVKNVLREHLFENFFHGLARSEVFLGQSGTCTEIIVL